MLKISFFFGNAEGENKKILINKLKTKFYLLLLTQIKLQIHVCFN